MMEEMALRDGIPDAGAAIARESDWTRWIAHISQVTRGVTGFEFNRKVL